MTTSSVAETSESKMGRRCPILRVPVLGPAPGRLLGGAPTLAFSRMYGLSNSDQDERRFLPRPCGRATRRDDSPTTHRTNPGNADPATRTVRHAPRGWTFLVKRRYEDATATGLTLAHVRLPVYSSLTVNLGSRLPSVLPDGKWVGHLQERR